MAKVGRFCGAVLAESDSQFYIVGDLKSPGNYETAGFVDPGELLPLEHHFVQLEVSGTAKIEMPYFNCQLEGEELALKLFHRLVIKRNGSVSDRLWNLIFEADENNGRDVIDASWLTEIPDEIWEIVQDEVL
ncbi:MAG: hypothetical protein N2C12_14270, partial [Planctomycetales bacterium]